MGGPFYPNLQYVSYIYIQGNFWEEVCKISLHFQGSYMCVTCLIFPLYVG